ncbi:MAG: hypothetical protein EOO25_05555, partial [Comamonadaceae bacterium]
MPIVAHATGHLPFHDPVCMTPEKEAEANRLSALKNLLVMDSPEEQAYDDITRFAASICGTPIA